MTPAPVEGKAAPLLAELQRRALELGAAGAWPADPARLPVRAWVRLQCQYGCGDYGRWLTCPPHAPPIELVERALGEYRRGLWVAAADHPGVNRLVRELRKAAFDAGCWQALALGAGHCDLCPECDLTACRHPRAASPSLEALGVSVLEALELHGIDPRPQGRLLCFGALLLE